MAWTVNHIRFATGLQLAELLQVSPKTLSLWTQGRTSFVMSSLDAGVKRGIPLEVLVMGLEKRREDMKRARRYQDEVQQLLSLVEVA